MAKETILVVDDSPEMLDILKTHFLNPMGYTVTTARDGKEGLTMAVSINPDLIFVDMNMPRMSGLEMLAQLRQTPCTSPVIFMTSYGSERIAVEAFRLGVRDYLNKPFSPEEVQRAVENALHEKRLEREREELSRSLLTAEAVRTTVVTLNHYLNNYLMVVYAGLKLLEEELVQKNADPSLIKVARDSYRSAQGINAVLQVLQNTTNVKLTTYTHASPMIDIQAALREALEQLQKNEKTNHQHQPETS